MFEGLFRKAPSKPQRNPVKEVLYGDLPLDQWPRPDSSDTGVPWPDFIAAREHLKSGQAPEATACLQRIIATPNLESLHYVEAWYFLRQSGVMPPPEDAKKVFGVIVEIGSSGVLIAAYRDYQARLYADSGKGVVWMRPDASIDPIINAIFEVATQVVLRLGPWDKPRLPMPSGDITRISFLTPSGLHFGQGPHKILCEDPNGKWVLQGANALMRALISKTEKPNS